MPGAGGPEAEAQGEAQGGKAGEAQGRKDQGTAIQPEPSKARVRNQAFQMAVGRAPR